MKKFVLGNHRILFYSIWLMLGLVQSYHTELMDDEAFYWMYSRFPALGYFEHPPLIALFTGAGYWLIKNALGIRLLIVILSTGTIYVVRQLSDSKNDFLFYAIVLSIFLTQLGGFLAVPDNLLIFFTALFFLILKKYIGRPNLLHAVQLGIVMALLLYSKYHGVLVILFTFLALPNLVLKYQTWIAFLITTLLFFPHLYWQHQYNFDTFQYQLFERNPDEYSFSFTINYILGQLLIAGPVLGWLLIWSAIKKSGVTSLQKALKFTMVGIYIFFLLQSLNKNIEPNWTVSVLIPLIVLSHEWLDQNLRLRNWVYKSVPITLVIVLVLRIALVYDIPYLDIKPELYGNKAAANKILIKAGKLPVVFLNSYQQASKYMYYTGRTSFSLNTADYHRNSYNYWPIEDSLIGRPTFVVGLSDSNKIWDPDSIGNRIENYFSFSKVRFIDVRNVTSGNHSMQVTCNIETPSDYLSLFKHAPYDSAAAYIACYFKASDTIIYRRTNLRLSEITKERMQVTFSCPVSQDQDPERLRIVISTCVPNHFSINSDFFHSVPKEEFSSIAHR